MASNVDAKLLKQTKFPPEFSKKVDMTKVNIEVMKKWIAGKLSELLGDEDDVIIELCFGLLESSRYPNIKALQIQLTGFLDKDTPKFCQELWNLCLSAQSSPQGVPKELLEAKKLELKQEKNELRKKHVGGKNKNASAKENWNLSDRERERTVTVGFVTTEGAGALTAEVHGLLGVTAQTGGVHLRAESLIPTYHEATGKAVEVLDRNPVQYRAHRLFPDHLLVARTAQMNATGDARDLQAGHRLQMEGITKEAGDKARHTVMIEIDLLPAMNHHHAHLVPEEPADAIPLSLRAVPHVHRHRHEIVEDVTVLLEPESDGIPVQFLHLAQGLDSRTTGIVGGGHHLARQKIVGQKLILL
ncbi:PWI domain mRNA processing protein, putative [Talaromyces marneffei ATCC 18224]|uniref:PWI domain mRNA processing protein, putative n=1 Tax=Talaromyces marneffei (strain ATCC 18224 / CBS 334.59 / QM 7333) TaxID=441960 RepID=B6QW15_TALMQ|nr:PWI domain mRNA processing protein, putative [Talaromyces marneffei ATCC 18224]